MFLFKEEMKVIWFLLVMYIANENDKSTFDGS